MVPDGSGQTALPPDTKPPNYPDLPGKVRIANTVPYYSKYRANLLDCCQKTLVFLESPCRSCAKTIPPGPPHAIRRCCNRNLSAISPCKNSSAAPCAGTVTTLHGYVLFLVFSNQEQRFPLRCQINNLRHTILLVSATNRKIFCSYCANNFARLRQGSLFR